MSETRNPDPRTIIQAAGLIAGPCLALLAYFLLPLEYKDANHQIPANITTHTIHLFDVRTPGSGLFVLITKQKERLIRHTVNSSIKTPDTDH